MWGDLGSIWVCGRPWRRSCTTPLSSAFENHRQRNLSGLQSTGSQGVGHDSNDFLHFLGGQGGAEQLILSQITGPRPIESLFRGNENTVKAVFISSDSRFDLKILKILCLFRELRLWPCFKFSEPLKRANFFPCRSNTKS